ncbi:winged helix-turn-helix transcriptional regulator [Saccharomonospora halophila]|uniref:winged helix-turn-helix transcriptional regulator n=1 Tax=Saccharomonospora halophila TaxID=129922 RepID=UPI000686F776
MIESVMEVIGGKWKLAILQHLFAGPRRFGQLRRALPSITQRMLTRQLRELEADGIVTRTVHPQVPPKVEYSVTETGASLEDIARRLDSWGRWYHGRRVGPDPAEQ